MLLLRSEATALDPLHPARHLITRAWLVLLPLVAGLLWLGTAPSHAAGESWSVTGIDRVGCDDRSWRVNLLASGVDGGSYVHRTVVTAGGKVYMNEVSTGSAAEGETYYWGLYAVQSGGPTTGSWPVPAGQPFKAVFTLERPAGTVLSSWTMVTRSCDSATLLYNGPTAADVDEDYLAIGQDLCPTLTSFRSDGCPLHDRSLGLKARYGPKRVAGRLYAAGRPALYAGRTVTVWKVRPGPDRKVATRTADGDGRFKARVRKGRYYATAPSLLVPSAGRATDVRSTTIRVR
jgi:hypothetical protein